MSIHKKPYQPGQHSTGPTSPEGKQSSSRNSTTHGCSAKQHVVLPNESQAEYDALEATYFEEYLPLGPMDKRFIQRVAELEWVRNRCDRHLHNKRTQIFLRTPDPCDWTPEDHKALDLLEKYSKTADRTWRSAWRDLQSLRRDRLQNSTGFQKLRTAFHYNLNKLGLPDTEVEPYPGSKPDTPPEGKEWNEPIPRSSH